LLSGEILLFPRDIAVFIFEYTNVRVSFPKEVKIACPDLQRLPFKGSLLLQNLVGPGYLELPF